MKIQILDDAKFEQILIDDGDTAIQAARTEAWVDGQVAYFRTSTPIEYIMSSIVHEGTHALDRISGFSLNATVRQLEKRAFFFEQQFQKAAGILVEHPDLNKLSQWIEKEPLYN